MSVIDQNGPAPAEQKARKTACLLCQDLLILVMWLLLILVVNTPLAGIHVWTLSSISQFRCSLNLRVATTEWVTEWLSSCQPTEMRYLVESWQMRVAELQRAATDANTDDTFASLRWSYLQMHDSSDSFNRASSWTGSDWCQPPGQREQLPNKYQSTSINTHNQNTRKTEQLLRWLFVIIIA